MVAYDNTLWEKQYVIFQQILIPLEKPVYAPVYSLFEILRNENFFKQFVANSLLPNCKKGFNKGGLYSKYLHWCCVNKCGKVDLENIGSVFNTKLSALTALPIAGFEGFWAISFLVKST